jgi:hypothetical protein
MTQLQCACAVNFNFNTRLMFHRSIRALPLCPRHSCHLLPNLLSRRFVLLQLPLV